MSEATLLDASGRQISTAALPAAAAAKPPALAGGGSTLTPMQLLERAVADKLDLAVIEKLMDLQDRWEKENARKAYVEAFTAFKAEPLVITRDKHVEYENSKKEIVAYDHATLANICNVIGPALSKHGLSHRWKTSQEEGGQIVVTCTLMHVLGHSEEVTLKSSRDESGGKNNIQAVGSTKTYLERYTLLAITGLAAVDQDDDGIGSEGGDEIETIDDEQVREIDTALRLTRSSLEKFLRHFKIKSLPDLPASRFDDAMALIEQKKKHQTGPVA